MIKPFFSALPTPLGRRSPEARGGGCRRAAATAADDDDSPTGVRAEAGAAAAMAAVEPEDFVGRGGFVFDVPAEVAALAVAVAFSLSAVVGVGVRPLAIAAAATGGAADEAGAAMTMGEVEVTVSDTAGAAGSADDFAAFRLDASEMYKSQPLRLTLHRMQL